MGELEKVLSNRWNPCNISTPTYKFSCASGRATSNALETLNHLTSLQAGSEPVDRSARDMFPRSFAFSCGCRGYVNLDRRALRCPGRICNSIKIKNQRATVEPPSEGLSA